MRAVRFHEFGGVDQLRLEDVPEPSPGPGEVKIKVGACALNHLDVDLREGISRFPLGLPHTIGTGACRRDRRGGAGRVGSLAGRRPRRAQPHGAGPPRRVLPHGPRQPRALRLHRLHDAGRLRGVHVRAGAPPRAHAGGHERRRRRRLPDRRLDGVPHALHARRAARRRDGPGQRRRLGRRLGGRAARAPRRRLRDRQRVVATRSWPAPASSACTRASTTRPTTSPRRSGA